MPKNSHFRLVIVRLLKVLVLHSMSKHFLLLKIYVDLCMSILTSTGIIDRPVVRAVTRSSLERRSAVQTLGRSNRTQCCQPRAYARGGGGLGVQTPPPIGLSTKMHSKENITFLALLSLFFCNDTDSNMI